MWVRRSRNLGNEVHVAYVVNIDFVLQNYNKPFSVHSNSKHTAGKCELADHRLPLVTVSIQSKHLCRFSEDKLLHIKAGHFRNIAYDEHVR